MSVDWDELLVAFLHDPPDKALSIPGHEQRAARCATAALGEEVSRRKLKSIAGIADSLAAIAERLPLPSAGDMGQRAVGPSPDGALLVCHPLSGKARELDPAPTGLSGTLEAIGRIVGGIDDSRARFLALWRLLPRELSHLRDLPAETRAPDHTIWHHADLTAGLYSALSAGPGGRAYLSFSLGPVQSFISAARSVRDLWTGSAILSWITFRAMLPVIRAVGPTAVIFPSLRGTPLMDLWLRDEGGLANKLQPPSDLARKRPSLPNRFLALVPWGEGGANASKIAAACEEAAREAWRELADAVRRKLDGILSDLDVEWARRWAMQIDSFFEMRTVCLPERECADDDLAKLLGRSQFGDTWPEAEKVRALARCLPAADRPGYDQENAGRWAAHVDMVARLLEARRSVRHVPDIPAPPQAGRSPPKCSLLGSYEQMGPDDLDASRRFWEQADKRALDGVRLRKGERFCAIALTKRFGVPALLAKELRLDPADLRFPDTATVAAADWLKRAGIEWTELRNPNGQRWNGQWLHWRGQHDDQDEDRVPDPTWQIVKDARDRLKDKPPAYYAILSMDADHMGRWLRGEKTPPIRDVYHPQLVRYFEGLGEHASGLLDARRPLGPALHAAISEALTNFAVHIVPGIVETHRGTLIYAGGDDVLALLPTRTVLACAAELRAAFRGEESWNNGAAEGYYRADGRDLLVMGPKATLSAGIAVVHRKEDLRLALSAARDAEKAAKHAGRDCLQVAVWRRSGERSSAPCSWPALAWMERLVDAFGKGASDRWAYRLCAELPTLEGDVLPTEAIEAEIRRAVDRSEEPTRQLLNPADPAAAGKVMAETFAKYLHVRQKREAGRNGGRGRVLGDFLTLCRTASFLARGRDE